MTHVGPGPAAGPSVASPSNSGFVEWGPIIAGAVLASAISFVLLTFGTAIGLTTTSPWPNSGLLAKVVAALAVFWVMVQQIGAFLAGGYVAGRMRSRWREAGEDEVDFRDGLHGGLVWAVGVAIGAALLMMAAGATARTGAEIGGKIAATTAASTSDPMDAVLDPMLRSAARPAGAAAPAGAPPANAADQRREMSRILATAVTPGGISNENRTYLAQLVAQRTGLPQPEAEKRVAEAINAAREAADKARRASILTGLVTAVGLVVSFGAAWWAGIQGGNHRDNSVPARFTFIPDRRRTRPVR